MAEDRKNAGNSDNTGRYINAGRKENITDGRSAVNVATARRNLNLRRNPNIADDRRYAVNPDAVRNGNAVNIPPEGRKDIPHLSNIGNRHKKIVRKPHGLIPHLNIKLLILILAIAAVVATVFICLIVKGTPKIKKEADVEIGTETVTADIFLRSSSENAHFKDETQFDLTKLGKYKVTLVVDNTEYDVVLNVVDTTAPTASEVPLLIQKGSEVDPNDLVSDISDKTKVTVSLDGKVDTSEIGPSEIDIILTDEGGNTTDYNIDVYIAEKVNRLKYEIGADLPKPEDFVSGVENIYFSKDISEIKINKPGRNYIGMKIKGKEYFVIIDAQDTIAPTAQAATGVTMFFGNGLPDPMTLVCNIVDKTTVAAAYKETYTAHALGELPVVVVLTDEGGNTCEVNAVIKVVSRNPDDVTAPVITSQDVNIYYGDALALAKYVTITDDYDGNIDLYDTNKVVIDNHLFNQYLSGNYKVHITVCDSAGNQADADVSVTVNNLTVDADTVYALADKAISKIIKSGMSREEKIKAAQNYVKSGSDMIYQDQSDKTNSVITEAYYAFTFKRGDCYTYYSMMAVLLDRLGINYYTVRRVPGCRSDHWWLLVDFGDGWYHVDPCYHGANYTMKNPDGSKFENFKMTEADLQKFTDFMETKIKNWKYYVFDKSLYPSTPVRNNDGSYTYTPYTLTYTAGEGGYINGNASQQIYHGKNGSAVTAVAGNGYEFVAWSDGIKNASRTDTALKNAALTANFKVTGAVSTFTLKYSAGKGGHIEGNTNQSVTGGLYGTSVTAIPDEGYTFFHWSDGVTDATRTDFASGNIDVTAVFNSIVPAKTYTLNYSAGNGGKISGQNKQVVNEGMQGTTVTAVPDTGYVFDGWSDGVKTATRTDTATADASYIAVFKSDKTFTLSYTAGEGGSISGNASQTVREGEKGTEVTAVPDEGFIFVGWEDGVEEATRQDDGISNLNVKALFESKDNSGSNSGQ